jgi:hypothetical protein
MTIYFCAPSFFFLSEVVQEDFFSKILHRGHPCGFSVFLLALVLCQTIAFVFREVGWEWIPEGSRGGEEDDWLRALSPEIPLRASPQVTMSSGLIADEAATASHEASCGGSHNLPPQWVEPRSLPASGEGDVVFEFHDPAAGRPFPMKVRYHWPRLFPIST